jgi:transposase InsO family protein
MVNNMKNSVYWDSIESDVRDFVRTCSLCQQHKKSKHTVSKRTRPIPINVFEDISIDVVGPVPYPSQGYEYILVTQDRLSRWISFDPMSNTSAEKTIRVLMNNWIYVYGVPKRILTDRGTNFTSKLFKEMAEFLGTKLNNTTAYRPQSNGQNERSHRELHTYLSIYLSNAKSKSWHTMLKLAAWIHNSSVHEALGMSPFEVVTGMKPNNAKAWLPTDTSQFPKILENFKKFYSVTPQQFEEIRNRARLSIQKAQARYLERNFKHNVPSRFFKNQQVLVRHHTSDKWSPKYRGPFIVKDLISPSVLIIFNPENNHEDIIHAEYARPYHTRDGSPRFVGTDIEDADPTSQKDDYVEFERRENQVSQPISPIPTGPTAPSMQGNTSQKSTPPIFRTPKQKPRFVSRLKSTLDSVRRRVTFQTPESEDESSDEHTSPDLLDTIIRNPHLSHSDLRRGERIRSEPRRIQLDPSKKTYD